VRRSDAGFTLLEVLAAVALLGILYTTVAGVAIQGLRAEGIAQRKLEASLLADERLAQIELQIEEGALPGSGSDEEEQDIFLIETSVEPFEIPIPEPEEGEETMGSLLTPIPVGGSDAPVRRIEIRVSWLEGEDEYAVERITYGYDPLTLADQLPLQQGDLSGALDGLGGLGASGSTGAGSDSPGSRRGSRGALGGDRGAEGATGRGSGRRGPRSGRGSDR